MLEPFEEALDRLLLEYDTRPLDEIISALELKLYALREQEEAERDG